MADLDLQHIKLLIGKTDPSVFKEFMDEVGNRSLLAYRAYLQWGGKEGESLYTHVLNGIQVLETLREHLALADDEARVLFTAFTVHDLNKVLDQQAAFGKLATHKNIAAEITRLGLAEFFPEWRSYREDIRSLIRGHSGSYHSGGERLIAQRDPEYRLGLDRVNALLSLMRAADRIDLSHSLSERAHKDKFLSELNAYLADSNKSIQYAFYTHRLTEQRGILTNVLHNAIVAHMVERHALIPLLYYPDGVAYLAIKGHTPLIPVDEVSDMAGRVAESLTGMTLSNFEQFIDPRPAGIKVDAKCLELGLSFEKIWLQIYNIIQRREPVPVDFDVKARARAEKDFEKNKAALPQMAERVQATLDDSALLVGDSPARLRLAELVRTYYIFLSEHFSAELPDAWQHIYELLELPEADWAYYAYFDARWDRAYVISRDLALNEEALYRRIETDGGTLIEEHIDSENPNAILFADYLARYAIFGNGLGMEIDPVDHLAQYVENQHRQCVYCSGPFPTDKWMAADVRSDITVQTFSNRLRGGGGEPKKYVCAICQIQFLLEKLDYPTVRGEKTLYLHLFPYSFLTQPFLQGLRATIRNVMAEDGALQALNMNASQAVEEYLDSRTVTPSFRSRTKKERPQPYGIYLPQYTETVGNLLIFPINPAGNNDTERFLYAFWNALILQRHFGVKVLMSDSAVPPLAKNEIPDLYIDNIPLGCQGLLPRNDFAQYVGDGDNEGPLASLWTDVGHLFALRRLTFSNDDNTPRLVRSLGGRPLTVFYETEKLLEAKLRGQEQTGGLLTWLMQEAYEHVSALELSRGGKFMALLSEQLERLAEIAWQNRLLGRSLEKSSLLFPVSEVFQKLNYAGGIADTEALKAAAIQDIFDHLSRIADDQYKPGRTKWEATQAYVDIWFDGVLNGVYGGNRRKLLNDEKLIRSAYHFYIRQQIPRKASDDAQDPESEFLIEAEV